MLEFEAGRIIMHNNAITAELEDDSAKEIKNLIRDNDGWVKVKIVVETPSPLERRELPAAL